MMRLFVVFSLLVSGVSGWSQVATGTYAFGTFDNHGFDTVNVGNLNVHFSVPVLNKSGRGLPFYYNLSYDSAVWYPNSINGSTVWTPVQSYGWRGDTEVATGYLSYASGSYIRRQGSVLLCTGQTTHYWVYHDTNGVSHSFNGGTSMYEDNTSNGTGGCPTSIPNSTSTSTDGSGLTLALTNGYNAVLTSAAGKITNPPISASGSGVVTDANGNQVSTDGNGNFTDTTGQVVLQVAGSAPNPQTFTYKDTTGTSRAVQVNYRTYTVQTNFGCSGVTEYGATSTSLVDSISLPDGQSVYHFTYEATPGYSNSVTGRLASVTLPGGGVIGYSYTGGNNGIVCGDGSAAGLTRTMLSDSPNTSWSYARSGANTNHTNVVDALNNNFDYDFVAATVPSGAQQPGAFFYEVNRNAWNGTISSPHALSQQTCFNNSGSFCINTAITLPIAQVDTFRTLTDVQMNGTTVKFNSYGGQTEVDSYDYGGSSSRGPLLSKESLGYGACGPANLVSSDVVTDGGGNTISSKAYCYDQTAVTATSNVPSHVAATGPRGNLTTATTYTGGGNGGPNLVTTATYTDTGSVLTSVDSINGTTSFSYDSTYTYATGSTLPTPSSGVSMTVGAGFDTANTGLPTSSTDVNNQQTRYSGYDPLLRPTEVDNPDGGQTKFWYTPSSTSTYVYQSANVYSDLETQLDGYGRLSRTAKANGQSSNPWYQQDTCYDGNGNVVFKSYSYQGTGWGTAKVCSGAGDSYTHDALGRTTKITHGDNSSVQYTYLGRATQVKDENGVTRITQADGLGRPSKICEIFSNATPLADGTTPASCGLDIVGNGAITNYAYTYINGGPAATVTQGAQTRTFQTDWIGRSLSTTEPERGVTTYAYSSNGTGAAVTRTRPKANQTNAATTTTTTTQYDTLSRPLSITYSDGTPTRTYLYDQANAWGINNNIPLGSSKGRLTRQMVNAGNGMGQVFGYDAMGRVVHLETCRWSTCGHAADQSNYTYDWTGNLLAASNPLTNISYSRSVAGEVTSITSSASNATDPATILSNFVNGPNGPISYSYGNGLSQYNIYDSVGRLQGGWVCTQAPAFGCGNGSQQVYGFDKTQTGSQISSAADNVTGPNTQYAYDEFNRLKSTNYNNGQQTFSYSYDRYGNRWAQNAPQGGWAPSFIFNTATNQINGSGITYDAAGNQTSDSFHSYQYDAEGNQTGVDNGQTAQYFYDALSQRVRIVTSGNSADQEPAYQEIDYDANGKRLSIWDGSAGSLIQAQVYWGSQPVAFYKDGAMHFQHQDWLGSERVTTSYNGATESSIGHYPFGEIKSSSGNEIDASQFGQLDHNIAANTEHAQFREYYNGDGHWLSPDPYDGSYDASNPQSFNRYAYVLNSPMSATDPSGLVRPQNSIDTYDGGNGLSIIGGGFSFGADWNLFQGLAGSYSSSQVYVVPTEGTPYMGTQQTFTFSSLALWLPGLGSTQKQGQNNLNKPTYTRTMNCGSSASQVMGAVEGNFGQYGNYSRYFGAESVSFAPPAGMGVGSTIPITIGILGVKQSLSVNVAAMNSGSMTFTTNPGHLIYPGSITFAASSAGAGAINFSISISGTVANSAEFNFGGSAFEDAQWNHFLGQVGSFCGVHP